MSSSPESYRRVASLKTAADFAAYLAQVGADLQFDAALQSGPDSPLGQPYTVPTQSGASFRLGNRFCILPMEGWDGTTDGRPSDLTIRRWRNFGLSGAKLIWGGEAVAVRMDGRANPNQLVSAETTNAALASLRETLVAAHAETGETTADLLIGLQLTHSGRFARPADKKRIEPQILYHHPLLDPKFGIAPDDPCMTDTEIDDLIGDFVRAAVRAQAAGYHFVDIKHCHGYLGHEFLSATTRAGRYGGSLENRMRFLREITAGIRRDAPGLDIGVRLSAFDLLPFRMGADKRGVPETHAGAYPYAFGGDTENPLQINLAETCAFLDALAPLGIHMVCVTAGSPYYNPHIQRPAMFPPSDGYLPPEDPLVGVARQINVTAQLRARYPNLLIAGSGYTYLQDWLPHVGQYYVRNGHVDFVGLGRMVLSYPELPRDVLRDGKLQTKRICRTFSDCTTGPRNGLVSGCYPLDPFYKTHPDAEALKEAKQRMK
ncbi:MAG: NADH:flavin oxidoreductase [Blastocatellia bacterium]